MKSSSPSPASTIGALYVLEGSIHGGKIILSALRKNLPDLAPSSCTFLSAFGPQAGLYWKNFSTWLNNLSLTEVERNSTCQAATETFRNFSRTIPPLQ